MRRVLNLRLHASIYAYLALCTFMLPSIPVCLGGQLLHPMPGDIKAPAFTLKDIDGKTHSLTDYKDKVLVINFWATWCPPCRFEMPSMERSYKLLAADRIVFLGINVGEDADTIFTFTADYPVSFPLLMDMDSSVINRYPVIGLPTTFVVTPGGRIVYRVIGTREWDDPQILERLKALAQQK